MTEDDRCPECESQCTKVEFHSLTFVGTILAVTVGIALYNIVYLIVNAIVEALVG